ncbi:MAG: hypothetical protein JSS82_15530 [Bacteroidetes bacterium]|nr:hypothetical protein [Bacteroidota bacterium]
MIARFLACFIASVLTFATPLAVLAQSGESSGNGNAYVAPATQSELSQRGVSLKLDVLTPTKGLASSIADLLRDGQYAKTLNNLQMLKRGVWSTRGTGWSKHAATQHNSGAIILEIQPYTDSSATKKLLFRAGSVYYDYNIGTQTATSIGTGFTASDVPCIRVYGRPTYAGPINCFFADGVHELQKWTGTGSMAASSYYPLTLSGKTFTKPKFLEEFQGRQALAGFADNANTVLITNSGNYESATASTPQVDTDGGWLDVPNVLGPITGLRTLRLNTNDTVLIVGCENGVAMVTGTGAQTFQVKEITREFGIVSNRTFIQAQNDLYFLATDGVRSFATSSIAGLLNLRKTALVQDLTNRLNKTYQAKAFAYFYPSTLEAQFWYPIDANTSPQNALILNFNTRDPNSSEDFGTAPIFSTKDGISPACANVGNGVAYAGTTNGYIMVMYSGDTYDGSDINWTYTSPLMGSNTPAQSASNRKFLIMTEGGNQSFTATAFTLTSMSDGTTKLLQQDSRVLTANSASVTDLSTWSSGTTTTYPKLIDFESRGSGRFWALKLSGGSGNHIDLVGVQSILTVGGLRQ